MESNQTIVDRCNALAIVFHKMKGFDVPSGTKMYECRHHDELNSWDLAVTAYHYLLSDDVDEVLANLDD